MNPTKMDSFSKRKSKTMELISSTINDKSPKGTIDEPIIPLLTTINNHPSYFTTSSCSGRISIFSHPPNRPKGGSWLFISHQLVHPNSVKTLLNSPESTQNELTQSESSNELVFRFEPLIIAVECKDVGSAQFLISLAISCGFRESGITSVSDKRVIVGIRCSIRLEVPLGCRGKVMVSDEYLEYLVCIANAKMEANLKRTNGFLEALKKNGFVGSTQSFEVSNGLNCEVDEGVENNLEMGHLASDDGPLGSHYSRSSITPIRIVGAPMERLFLWGHSCCTIDRKKILLYGGFGGIGRHARRNDCLLFDPESGEVVTLNVKGAPCPRVGHTSSSVGDFMFVIGGRADPANILDDIWAFNIPKAKWKLMQCGGDVFSPRHRHAAVSIGSKIYVFGGLKNDTLYSSLLVLDVETLQWKEVNASGEWPCARHSHSLAAHGFKLYLFGGYNGERALEDLYSFDVRECQWSKVNAMGKPPYARFSHSMFVYKDFLGIIGGCPVRQHCQELSLLDLQNLSWKHVVLDSVGKELFVRSTANVVDDNLITIGGGAACYAFGAKFSEPTRINLLPLVLGDASLSSLVAEQKIMPHYEDFAERGKIVENGLSEFSRLYPNLNSNGNTISGDTGLAANNTYWVLKLQKKHAKLAKDILKKFGWLDLARKVRSHIDGSCIYFPVTEKFCSMFSNEVAQTRNCSEQLNDLVLSKTSIESNSAALDLLVSCGATKHIDEFVTMKKAAMSPLDLMRADVSLLLEHKGLSQSLLEQLPKRWERLGDIVVLPSTCFNDPAWETIDSELWSIVAKALGARRLARQDRVASNGTRDSRLKILIGDNGWVEHRENGILYSFDATKCMFSWGNLSEKLRMARMDCKGEVIVDLFAGIGYFTLPFLVRSQAKFVYACEWNPFAVEALQHNLEANSVSDRCIVLEGDNRATAPKEIADRVCLGLLPSSEGSWVSAVRALREEGGMLHIHGNVKDSEETQWKEHVLKSICEIARSEGRSWDLTMVHLERVKWYAPHIRHVVADVKCTMTQRRV